MPSLSLTVWCQCSSSKQGMAGDSDHLSFFLSLPWVLVALTLRNACVRQWPPHCLSLFSLSLCFLSWSLCPLQSCWMTSTLWSGCCALFPLTAQGAGQSPWMPRWRTTCISAPTTCASSGTGCAQARMTPSASTVPPATGWLLPLPWLGLIALLTAFLAGEPT